MYHDIELHAPPGKIRFIGTEHGQDFLIGDFDDDISPQEITGIMEANRGVGIDIRTVTDKDGPEEE
jgi:hypothetical protein